MSTTQSQSQTRLWFIAAIGALVWLGFYRLSGGFGFYEDDLHFFGATINFGSVDDLWNWIKFCWTRWPQGRPTGYSAMYSLGFFADRLGGPSVFQLFGFLIVFANSLLFHGFVARQIGRAVAIPATLFYALASIDTVQPAFTFGFYYQVAVLFMLLACHAYCSRWRPLSYLFLALAMTSQEPITVAFLFVPWLVLPWNRQGVRQWVWHAIAWAAVIGGILVARRIIGEPWGADRVEQIIGSPVETLLRSLQSVTQGFVVHSKLAVARPVLAWGQLSVPGALAMLVAAPVLYRLLSGSQTTAIAGSAESAAAVSDRPLLRTAVVGLACMSLPYAAYFRDYWHPCAAETGFFSAVHVMTKFGGALVVGALWAWALQKTRGPWQTGTRLVAAAYFASWILFGQLLQADYSRNHRGQVDFWNAVVRLCPDLEDGTDILVMDTGLPRPKYINQFTWPDELTPSRLFVFPATWARAPRAYLVNGDIAGHHIRLDQGVYRWIFHPSILNHAKAQSETIAPGTIIVLRWTSAGYERVFGEILVKDGALPVKSLGRPSLPELPRRPYARYFGLPPALPAGTNATTP